MLGARRCGVGVHLKSVRIVLVSRLLLYKDNLRKKDGELTERCILSEMAMTSARGISSIEHGATVKRIRFNLNSIPKRTTRTTTRTKIQPLNPRRSLTKHGTEQNVRTWCIGGDQG